MSGKTVWPFAVSILLMAAGAQAFAEPPMSAFAPKGTLLASSHPTRM
jgi:hypothetical protein